MKKLIVQIAAAFVFISFSFNLHAAQVPSNISPQQLEQFKKLAPAQQKSLAQSMGIDIRTIQAQLNGSKSKKGNKEEQLQQYYPRGTMFDESGNPTLHQDILVGYDNDPQPFGYDVFANAPMTFAPSIDIAIPDGYLVGVGDILSIQIFGKENQDYELSVSREGEVMIPELGPFRVSGLTFVEMKNSLGNTIKNKVLGVDVVITLSKLRSMRVFVLGDAFKPGTYVLSALSSITHAIFSAGGISNIGSLRNIQLKRAGKLVTTLDLYDLLIHGDSSNDLMLKSGDVIFIAPVGERVTIAGEVSRPAIYELSDSENFGSVIKMAGGLLPSSYPSSTVVERYNQQNLRTLLNIDLSKAEYLNKAVKNGDLVRVMKTSELFDQSVTIIGAVSRPGNYQWQEGQRVTDLLPNINAYLLNNADLTYSVIVRQKDVGRNIEVLQFGLFDAISDTNSVNNLYLKANDKILIFSNVEVPSLNVTTLDSLAWTRDELLDKEKERAEREYENKLFWKKYGNTGVAHNAQNATAETLDLAAQSLEELTTTRQKKTTTKDLGLFSRKRLLTPIIQQLTRQATFGQPLEVVEVAGAVKYPGIYPLTENSRVKNLVIAAGGLLESAYLSKAEVTRSGIDQFKAKQLLVDIDLRQALNEDVTSNIPLESKDRLNIHHIPAWQENHIIELRGEFLFPGKYTIQRGETLAQLVERVGGFTEFAYTDSSFFTRKGLKQLEMQNIIKVSENLRSEIASKSLTQDGGSQGIDYQQAKILLADLTKITPVGRLVVDIPRVMSDVSFDVALEDGDMLYIPSKQNSINVIGQVQVPTSHIYQSGLSAFDYVDLSGGAKKQADNDRVYVIKANGRVEIPNNGNWFSQNNNELKPGDTVVVPLDSYYMNDFTLWQSVTQIVYNAAVALKAVGIFQ